jgi:lipopolysaccharide export system permease protein
MKSAKAIWNGSFWEFLNPNCFEWKDGILVNTETTDFTRFNEPPELFLRNTKDVEQMQAKQAKLFINELRESGLEYNDALADYYRRFAFSATPLVVIILSLSMGGRFRKNILLMSLLSSLLVAVLYYVLQMVTMMLAKLGYIPPLIGAWFPSSFFIIFALFLIRRPGHERNPIPFLVLNKLRKTFFSGTDRSAQFAHGDVQTPVFMPDWNKCYRLKHFTQKNLNGQDLK